MTVVGHLCTYKGREVSTDRAGVTKHWGLCKHILDIQGFLGTCGVCRMYIKDYSKIAELLVKLTRLNTPFTWEQDQQRAMDSLKNAVINSPAL